MNKLLILHADVCRTFANSKRLAIIGALQNEEKTATQLIKELSINKANLSQHMAILIQKGVVLSRRQGLNVYYKLSDERISKACDLMREVLIRRLEKDSKILKSLKRKK